MTTEIRENDILKRQSSGEFGQSIDAANFVEILRTLELAFEKLQSLREVTDIKKLRAEFSLPEEGVDLRKAKRQYEASLVKQALQRTGGHQSRAAKLLNVRATTLSSIIKRHGLKN